MQLAGTLMRLKEMLARLRAVRADIRATRAQVQDLTRASDRLAARLEEIATATATSDAQRRADHERQLQAVRIARDADAASRAALWQLRRSAHYEPAFEENEPLVTVIISTYRNWPLLRDRALPSLLAQTYERWQAIIVGDGAPDDARRVVSSFADDRLEFVNLPYRGPYPVDPLEAWLIVGTTTWNTGLELARGRWIASCGDDDALRPGCLEALLTAAREQRAEVAYGYIHQCEPDSQGRRLGTFPPTAGQWNLQASVLHRGLRFMSMQPTDWMFGIPNDWSLGERMLRIGVRFSMIEETVVDTYPSALWGSHRPNDVE